MCDGLILSKLDAEELLVEATLHAYYVHTADEDDTPAISDEEVKRCVESIVLGSLEEYEESKKLINMRDIVNAIEITKLLDETDFGKQFPIDVKYFVDKLGRKYDEKES